jgi:hypothetical protein
MVYTLQDHENLCDVAKRSGVPLEWIVLRNDIQSDMAVVPGLQLFVPIPPVPRDSRQYDPEQTWHKDYSE